MSKRLSLWRSGNWDVVALPYDGQTLYAPSTVADGTYVEELTPQQTTEIPAGIPFILPLDAGNKIADPLAAGGRFLKLTGCYLMRGGITAAIYGAKIE